MTVPQFILRASLYKDDAAYARKFDSMENLWRAAGLDMLLLICIEPGVLCTRQLRSIALHCADLVSASSTVSPEWKAACDTARDYEEGSASLASLEKARESIFNAQRDYDWRIAWAVTQTDHTCLGCSIYLFVCRACKRYDMSGVADWIKKNIKPDFTK